MTEAQWRTHRLELDDQTLREWDAVVLDSGADGIVLDRSAFYPGGGGQPPDEGVLLWGGVQTRIAGARKKPAAAVAPTAVLRKNLRRLKRNGQRDIMPLLVIAPSLTLVAAAIYTILSRLKRVVCR